MSDYLPNDVVVEILARVPVRSLLRFTSVCKLWYSLITNPSFISTQLNRTISNTTTTNNHLLFVRHYNMFQDIGRYAIHFDNESLDVYMELECPFTTVNDYFRIVGVCNGLICLSDDYDSHTDTVIIWNPSIRKSVNLPQPGLRFASHGMCLLGFGVDSLNDDYKVVRVLYEAENHNYKVPPSVEVYTLNTGTWRNISAAASTPFVLHGFFTLPTFLNGAVHWVASNCIDDNSFRSLIVGFDMGAEVFREMMLPESVAHTDVLKLSVSVRGTSLALTQYQKIWQSENCWVWVMKEYGVVKSWTKLFTIDMREGIRTFMGFRSNNDVLLSARVRGLVSYDPNIKQIKYLRIHGSNRSFYADSYVESLVLLKGENRVLAQANSYHAISNGVANISVREEDRVEEQQ
ncbi:F-box protein CPR1-like [Cornus florida]|uniref:F-box protein CPR1-like n=1 Tax=Cornus florida TaxID=4283 RepID=UPI0028A04CC9|nr:F-box protein CPR1-like [Cornus florida]